MDERWKAYIVQTYCKLKNDTIRFASIAGGRYQESNNYGSSIIMQRATAMSAGVLTFGGVHAVSCLVQGAYLGISTGTMAPIPSLFGVATVALASFASHSSAICTDHFRRARQQRNKSIPDSLKYAWNHRPSILDRQYYSDFGIFGSNEQHNYLHTMRVCVVGLLCFKLLGGRFWSVAPSSYTHVGSYARGSIAATDQYATPVQRQAIQRLGSIFGCHTCGTKPFLPSLTTMSFIGDHQPPKSVANQLNQQFIRRLFGFKVPFRFYPHCAACSNKQGGILASATFDLAKAKSWNQWFKTLATPKLNIQSLRSAGGGKNAYVHGLQPRLHFLTGGIVAAIAFDDNDQGRQRYLDMQSYLTTTFQQPCVEILQFCHLFHRRKVLRPVSRARRQFHRRYGTPIFAKFDLRRRSKL
jgi:hypothetical protein